MLRRRRSSDVFPKDCGAWLSKGAAAMSILSSEDRYSGLKLPPVSFGVPPVGTTRQAETPREHELDLLRRVRVLEEEREMLHVRLASLEARERSVAQAAEAIEAQRAKLVEVREEYEDRRRVLVRRAAELTHERAQLREAEEDLAEARVRLNERESRLAGREAALVEREAASALVEPEPAVPERRLVPPSSTTPAVPEPRNDAPTAQAKAEPASTASALPEPRNDAPTAQPKAEPADDGDWWSKILGRPLEAA
jgi:hypothetical protein